MQNFINTFTKGGVSGDAKEVIVDRGTNLSDVLMENNIVGSKNEWRRLVAGGAVSSITTNTKIKDPNIKII